MGKYNYPPGYSFFATYQRAIKLANSPLESISESIERFGDSYTVYSGYPGRMILTQDPEFIDHVLRKNHKNYHKSELVSKKLGRFIGNGLLSSNGSYWLRQRRLIQPGFHHQKIQGLFAIMKKTIDEFLAKFPTGERVDVYPTLNRIALEVVINTLFDIDIPQASVNDLSRFVSETQEFVIKDMRQPYKSWWFALNGEVKENFRKASVSRDILRAIIRERQAGKEKFNDLLDMLLDARYEDTGEPMTEEQLLDEILILIIAGHETTANALTWALYLLAKHPQEIEKVRQATAGLDIQESVSHPLLNAVVNESMRLYPPAWGSDRVALEDDSFKDYSWPAGTVLLLYYYGLHVSDRYWKDAAAFSPDRFLNADKEKLKNFFPFGAGPRLCIGNSFALAEMALFLQAFIHRFDLTPTDVVPKMNPLVTLRPEGVILGVSRK